MSDTTSRALRRAWRNTVGDPVTNDLPVPKLLELLRNLEATTYASILDAESESVVRDFINDDKNQKMTISFDLFSPFFHELVKKPLRSFIGTPPKLNLNTNPTTNFINRELLNLKNKNRLNEEEIQYQSDLVNQLEQQNENHIFNEGQIRFANRKLQKELGIADNYISDLHKYDKNENEIRQQLRQQISLQKQLIHDIKFLREDVAKGQKALQVEDVFNQPLPVPQKMDMTPLTKTGPKNSRFHWRRALFVVILLFMTLSGFNFLLESYEDYVNNGWYDELML